MTRPSQAFHALEKLRNSFSVTLSRKGIALSDRDSKTVIDVYTMWILLMIDLGYLRPDSFLRVAHRLFTDFVKVDVLHLNNVVAELLYLVKIQQTRGFKALCSEVSTHLYTLVKKDVLLLPHADVDAVRRLVQLFSFTSRLSLSDIDLTQQCLDDYLRVEERLSTQTYPEHITKWLNYYVKQWFGPHLPSEIIPQHGPGGVAGVGRCSLETKYLNLASDQLLAYSCTPVDVSRGALLPPVLERMSQTIFVPKSYKTFRTISMEPASLMFYQQGVLGAIDRQVSSSSYLRNRMGTHEQERNKRLAQEGSRTREWATIDLSAASDSVGYELVKKVFKGTWILRYAVSTRSPRTLLPDNRIISLKKFAPMGSALCFPIETIIFSAICELVTRVYGVPGKYSVYGDDIIVPTQCVSSLISILSQLGFITNREKSFSSDTCHYRESCGGEYWMGEDITPMRVSRKYSSELDNVRLTSLVDSANQAYSMGYRYLRSFFVQRLLRSEYTPLFAPTSLQGDSYTNYHTMKRWNRKLQRFEVLSSTVESRELRDYISSEVESIRYQHWLISTHNRLSVERGFESMIGPTTMNLKKAWMCKPYECLDQVHIDRMLRRR